MSQKYIRSTNCIDELTYARNHNLKMVLVFLDDVMLPDEMDILFGRVSEFYKL